MPRRSDARSAATSMMEGLPKPVQGITEKQARFVKAYVESGDPEKAVRQAYTAQPQNVHRMSAQVLAMTPVKQAIADILEAQGVTREHLSMRLKEQTDAERTDEDGVPIAPDNTARFNAVKLGFQLYGALNQPTDGSGITIHVDADRIGALFALAVGHKDGSNQDERA